MMISISVKYYLRRLLFLKYFIFLIPCFIKLPVYVNPYSIIFIFFYDSFCNIKQSFFINQILLVISTINKWYVIKIATLVNFFFCFSFFVLSFIIKLVNNDLNQPFLDSYKFITCFIIGSIIGIEISNLSKVNRGIKYFIFILSLQLFTSTFNEILSIELSVPIFLVTIISYIQIRNTYFKKQRFDYDYD